MQHIHWSKSDIANASERKVYKHIENNGGWDMVRISILEKDIPEEKLKTVEQSYINKDNEYCLNSYNAVAPLVQARIPIRSEARKASDRSYYEKNKEKIKARRMERYNHDKTDPEKIKRIRKKATEAQKRYDLKTAASGREKDDGGRL